MLYGLSKLKLNVISFKIMVCMKNSNTLSSVIVHNSIFSINKTTMAL